MSATPLMPVEEALKHVLASVAAPTEREEVALAEAYGRTLASDVVSRRVQPPFANSAMDGYALRAADAAYASARVTVVGESAAGRPFDGRLGPGEAARIFTGAPLPEGADAVAMQENARREGETVILIAPVAPGDHVRAPGGDFDAGEIVLRAGHRLFARDLALAAAANYPTLAVRGRPRVAILASGDELVAPGATLGPAQIVSSNTYAVAGIVAAAGGVPIDLGIAGDDPAALAGKLAQAVAERADALVTLGGASVGDRDLTQQALLDAGMDLGFLARRHAAGQAANPRPARRDDRARPAGEPDLVDALRAVIPAAARPSAARRPRGQRRSDRAGAARRGPTGQRRASRLRARDAGARRRRSRLGDADREPGTPRWSRRLPTPTRCWCARRTRPPPLRAKCVGSSASHRSGREARYTRFPSLSTGSRRFFNRRMVPII